MVMFAEVRKDGQWHKVGKWFVSTYEEMEGQLTDRVFDKNDKTLISFLSSQSWSIMPKDVSAEIKNNKYFQGEDIHFTTLIELLDFDWGKEIYDIGYMTEWQYERFKNLGIAPVNIVKDAFRGDNIVVSPFLMDMIIEYSALRQQGRYFVEYRYNKSTMRDKCDLFFQLSIPSLIELIPKGGTAHDVRIIFSI